jgi:type II secretory pathway pseudopilin PulG
MNSSNIDNSKQQGFALIASLSIMAILVLIGVALFSLSSVASRNAALQKARTEAQANAKMALMTAIGELQKQMGPDQRISANGAITAETPDETVAHPRWTGVWDSWVAGDPNDAPVKDPSNHSVSHHATIGPIADESEMHPYYSAKDDYFRAWLLSLSPGEAAAIGSANAPNLTGPLLPGAEENSVQLVGEGSLGTEADGADPADFISVRLLPINASAAGTAPRGRYGWWVGDESQKARIMGDSYITNADTSLAARLARQQSSGSMGTRTIPGLESISDDLANEQKLDALPSLKTLSLVDGASSDDFNLHDATIFSYGVLADVREGGLKRDLSTLLERPVLLSEDSDDFMLYRFGQERVPIQDLSAYYQLYKGSFGDAAGNAGVQYPLRAESHDYGNKSESGKFTRGYTNLYRQPVPVKIQLLVGLGAVPRSFTSPRSDQGEFATHKLVLTISPSITLWNPSNLPLIVDTENLSFALDNFPLGIRWNKNEGEYITPDTGDDRYTPTDLALAFVQMGTGKNFLFKLGFKENTLQFEPGEVKTLSLPDVDAIDFNPWASSENWVLEEDWNPDSFIFLPRSARTSSAETSGNNEYPHIEGRGLIFDADDTISFFIKADHPGPATGSAFSFNMRDTRYQNIGQPVSWWYRHFEVNSKEGNSQGLDQGILDFNEELFNKGFPDGLDTIESLPYTGANIIAASENDQSFPIFQVSLMAASETNESANGGAFNGRKFPSRPFLHSTGLSPKTVDASDYNSLYNYGWNWTIEPMNSVLDAQIQVSPEGNGYYGGGYGAESGTTHVVQQEIPVIPPLSIASLSHAHLGGYSLATAEDTQTVFEEGPMATGKGGMAPHTLQAIGNSYAHPLISAESSSKTWSRQFDDRESPMDMVFADHSYLANKALWDEFFFSSITPQPASVQAFGGSERSAKEVATGFFLNDGSLPNRRMTPSRTELDTAKLDQLFNEADVFGNGYQGNFGLADKIAAYLMVKGPFNVNSTSVEAWRALLSSLKGKPVAYLDKDKALAGVTDPDEAITTGTPISAFTMPNAQPSAASSEPSDPEQWLGWRELNDTEIQELAEAIVRQVKLRGPFLSLSEFVNRRLDSDNLDLSVKGALQAALDDAGVSINANFRDNFAREFSANEISLMTPEFPAALAGPIAYGSAAYVDQADLLRNFASQLTPRGDTFVIRSYGDAIEVTGEVSARAWCEAIVQRMPEYVDPTADEAYEKTASLEPNNKQFGRKFKIVSFRWLSKDEI